MSEVERGEAAGGETEARGERRSQALEDRRAKLDALRARGIEPYAYNYDVTASAAQARAAFESVERAGEVEAGASPAGATFRLAGRLVSLRSHGKTLFADLEDASGGIQLYFKKSILGEDAFGLLGLLDPGDWIGAEGPLFRTRAGEVTLEVREFRLLAKSVRPLPIGKVGEGARGETRVWGGFADTEQRYRQRYADLAVNRDVRDVFVLRSRVVSALRRFLDARGYLEVETPVLQPLYGGASARPFVTHHHTLDMPLYLRIADELYLKRLIVGGLERVYEIGKDFRNEGIDRTHFPEFTMLEFYQAFADYEEMMRLVEEMFVALVEEVTGGGHRIHHGPLELDFTPPFRRLRYFDALREYGELDVAALDDAALRGAAASLGVADVGALSRPKLIDELFKDLVEPHLAQPVFVLDHPRELSPLAKPKRGEPALVERFELMIAGRELANAFSELNDPFDQRERFEAQVRLREQGDEEAQGLDEDYIRALEYGMPPTGGVGVGVDRLVMLLANQASIRDVILFPAMRPE